MSDKLIERLKEITGVSFVSVTYVNQQNEKHQTLFNVGVDYNKAKQKDIEFLKQLDVSTIKSHLGVELLENARVELLNSFLKPSKTRSEGIANAYTHLGHGLKIHNETQTIYVYGMKVHKRVIEEGNYQEDTRSELTKAKDAIRATLKSTQYRQFKIESSLQYKISGDTIIFGE
jgi:hypothetical protein